MSLFQHQDYINILFLKFINIYKNVNMLHLYIKFDTLMKSPTFLVDFSGIFRMFYVHYYFFHK